MEKVFQAEAIGCTKALSPETMWYMCITTSRLVAFMHRV